MQDGCTHVRKFSELLIGNRAYYCGIVNALGICHKETGYVGPVLVYACRCSACHDRAGDVRTAARERFDRSVGHRTVETGDNSVVISRKIISENLICSLCIEVTVIIKEDALLCVDKVEIKVFCENHSVEVFSSGCYVVSTGVMQEGMSDLFKYLGKIEVKLKIANYLIVSLFDSFKYFGNVLFICRQLVATVKHISNLGIFAISLSRGGSNYIFTVGIALNYFRNLAEMLSVSKRAAAKLKDFQTHS